MLMLFVEMRSRVPLGDARRRFTTMMVKVRAPVKMLAVCYPIAKPRLVTPSCSETARVEVALS